MKPSYLIGVDLGTSSTKAALYRSDGTLVAQASAEVPIFYPEPGVVEQDNNDFYNTAAQTVQECIRESGVDARHVAAIAFDSQMAGVGNIDEDFNPATRFDSWLHMRCKPYIEYIDKNFGDLVTRLTGCPPTCDHGPKILWWKEERQQDYNKIVKFLTPSGYVAGKLAGLRADQAFMDYTFIHFSGLSDAQNGCWSTELIGKLGVDPEKLPLIVEPWKPVGETSEKTARDFGLVPGIIIAAGCGDTAANALGAGIVKPGMLFDVAGTAAVLAGCTDTYISDEKNRVLLTMRSVIPGLWNPLAYVAGGGIVLRWFRDNFYSRYLGQKQTLTADLYDEMITQVREISPGSDGLIFSPHLGGRICPAAPEMRGAWLEISWSHTQPHFIRSVLESVAYEYSYYLSILCSLIPDLELIEARVVGGGAQSMVWNQIKADVLGVPYQSLQGNEFGTWGSAMVAGKAAGFFNDLAEIASSKALPSNMSIQPDPVAHRVYRSYITKYIEWMRILGKKFSMPSNDLIV